MSVLRAQAKSNEHRQGQNCQHVGDETCGA
jgi:hypothetical protein